MSTVLENTTAGKSQDVPLATLIHELYGDRPGAEAAQRAACELQSTARQAFRMAVAEVAASAKATLPECNGRVEKAVALVLAGDVELLDDGHARVASGYSAQTTYFVNSTCECKDFEKAPSQWCKHRIAAGLMKRSVALAGKRLDAAPPAPAPDVVPPAAATMEETPAVVETPADVPAQFIVSLHGKNFVTYAGLLSLAHQRGLVSLSASFISVTSELALAAATATFSDGRTFTEAADATPANVGAKVKAHYARMALTRAKARCLRDALNISICSLEEVGE